MQLSLRGRSVFWGRKQHKVHPDAISFTTMRSPAVHPRAWLPPLVVRSGQFCTSLEKRKHCSSGWPYRQGHLFSLTLCAPTPAQFAAPLASPLAAPLATFLLGL